MGKVSATYRYADLTAQRRNDGDGAGSTRWPKDFDCLRIVQRTPSGQSCGTPNAPDAHPISTRDNADGRVLERRISG
jgi:hypothetical protein